MKRENMKIWAEFFVTLLRIVKGEYLLCLNTNHKMSCGDQEIRLFKFHTVELYICAWLASYSGRSTLDYKVQ